MGHDHEGQRVSRRRMIAGIGSLGLGGLIAACTGQPVTTSTGESVTPQATTAQDLTSLFDGANTCTLTPATTAGPYYFDADKVRADIREDREGVRLRVAVKVQDSGSCRPIKDAVVEIWHCDAGGLYSGAEAMSRGGGALSASSPDLDPQDDERYLRGAQVTNADGVVEFTTIWPGWYRGRCVHIHAMVHVSDARVLTTQMMFDEALNDRVLAGRPYAARGERDTRNDGDGIFRDEMLMKVTPDGDGYVGAIVLAADPDGDSG
ncbi:MULTISPECIES: intradiol ring-cleavage dioxygenase [Nonomuraea]|uniref:Intradiol ring-cleavage dioxygenase n=1 Tax=Nonomuraea harbinensis TaxID=1286938 RepID=A0ABW1BMM8_9ACTN|nr:MULTISPECIES: intradiol ring-cleavage dioxygenase [Nonomuraea]TXK34467.1 intradiol ring-cleavage dioxygenase [Nonomuraea sp. C10]